MAFQQPYGATDKTKPDKPIAAVASPRAQDEEWNCAPTSVHCKTPPANCCRLESCVQHWPGHRETGRADLPTLEFAFSIWRCAGSSAVVFKNLLSTLPSPHSPLPAAGLAGSYTLVTPCRRRLPSLLSVTALKGASLVWSWILASRRKRKPK